MIATALGIIDKVARYEIYLLYMQLQTFDPFCQGYVLIFGALEFGQKYSRIKQFFKHKSSGLNKN